MELTYTVKPDESGKELKGLLRNRLRLSMAMIRRLKSDSGILVNGMSVFTNYRVEAGDHICVRLSELPTDIPAECGSLDILYEDEWFLAVNKPRGLITHPSRSRYTGTLLNYALYYIEQQGGRAVHAINRLDRDTSGIVLLAKSGYAKNLCSSVDIEKTYQALVWGSPEPKKGIIELPIKREREREMRRIISPDGDPAVTKYKVTAGYDQFSLLSLKLMTGRTHQIRVHCRALGHPVLGDKLYGTKESLALAERLDIEPHMLHACRLSFMHPVTWEPFDVSCPPNWRIVENPCFPS